VPKRDTVRRCPSCKAVVGKHIDQHVCPMFRVEPPLPPADPTFKIVPEGMRNNPEALERWKRYVNNRG
jgi:hypothetical protein